MSDEQPRMLVVLDSEETSQAALGLAQRYASETTILKSWSVTTPEDAKGVTTSKSAEPTISEALELAAKQGIAWLGLRRSFMPARELLGELLLATAQHTADEIPGYGVFLVDGEPKPFQHILAIFDRSQGAMSGLLAYASVAVADTYGAQLDILVIGSGDENPHTEDTFGALAISREEELYEAAVNRAREHQVRVNWITAASVTDLWPVIADQLSQHDYDLVVDDLGDVSMRRMRQRSALEAALAKGAAGETPLRLLTETELPVLLVIDEIRLRWAPEGVLKAGAAAALAVGVVGSPVAMAAASPAAIPIATTDGKRDPASEVIADLEEALDVASDEADDEEKAEAAERAAQAASASRGATTGARAAAEAGGTVIIPNVKPAATQYSTGDQLSTSVQPGVAVSAASVVPTSLTPKPLSTDSDSQEEQSQRKKERKAAAKSSSRAKASGTSTVKAPKGGATPRQVANTAREAAKDRAALSRDQAREQRAKAGLAELKDDITDVERAGLVALADLKAAALSHEEAEQHAGEVQQAATGVNAVIPGVGPSEEEVQAALAAEAVAADRLDQAVETGEEVLEDMQSAESKLDKQKDRLAERRSDLKSSRAEAENSARKAAVYKASMRATKVTPVAKGSYRLTARFGQAGSYWSSGYHTGTDFAAASGTPVRAAASGTVVSSGYAGAYGNRIVIRHGNGLETTYNHLSAIAVSPGQKVSTGQQIGRVGSTGNSTGPHLHFELKRNGSFSNPESWLGM